MPATPMHVRTPEPMNLFLTVLAGAASLAAGHALAATAEESYKAKCSTCHDAALAKTNGIVGKDIKPEAADGNVILRSLVDNAEQIRSAEAVTAKITG